MPASGGKGGKATNADLQDDEDVMYRRKIFGDWKATKKEKRQIGPMIIYSKSPAPPKK